MTAVALVDLLDAERRRDGEVHRLAREGGEPVERGGREPDEVALVETALGETDENRAGTDARARSVPLKETLPLQRADEPRGRALR